MELTIQGLSKIFNGRHGNGAFTALKNIHFRVASGEFISIVGPSGCGKTTLIEIIAGLQEKTEGDIMVDSVALDNSNANRAIVFQQYGLFAWLTVEKNIQYGPKLRGVRKNERQAISEKLMEMVGLNGFQRHYPHELSGGMQQRVALARALANDPDLLFLDEPFAALDAQTREICQQELLKLWKKTGITILFVTHDIAEAVFLSDKVYVMSSCPGTIKACIDIRLQRPRDYHLRTSKEFRDKEACVRNLLKENKEMVDYA